MAYAVITLDEAYLFIDSSKVMDPLVVAHLSSGGIMCKRYDDIEIFLNKQSTKGKVMIDPVQLNWRLYLAIKGSGKGENMIEHVSPLTLQKSVKNQAELDGMRASHVRDGAALTAFLCWLENAVSSDAMITEYDVAVKIEEFRGRAKMHVGPSFDTIAGYTKNGAIIHYKPEKATASTLGKGMFLLDSGAQYLDGTTDVTRTLHFGEPSEREKMCYTLVLKGHIALATAVFPEGT